MKPIQTQLLAGTVAALLWLLIGVIQRTRTGTPFTEAVVQELPLTALVFALAFVWARFRNRK